MVVIVKRVAKREICILVMLAVFVSFGAGLPEARAAGKAVKLNITRKTIKTGSRFRLKVKGYSAKKGKLRWKSNNKKIASVNAKGMVTGKKAGKTKITVHYAGQKRKAVCVVTVTKKASPKHSTAPAPAGTETSRPAATAKPSTATEAPTAASTPAVSATPVDSSIFVVSTKVVEVKGETMTAYVINKRYYGDMILRFNGKEYKQKDTGRKLITLFATGVTTRENSSKTIRVSRTSKDEDWTIQDLEAGKTYYMRADRQNTIDPAWEDCGVIFLKGDVRSEFEISTGK